MNKKYIIITSVVSCFILYLIEQVIKSDYIIKTAFKIILFLVIPYYYLKIKKRSYYNEANGKIDDNKNIKLGFLFGAAAFLILIITYISLSKVINFNIILNELHQKSKVNASNFVFVGLYITFINSLLEEYFFRGFIFLNLYKSNHKKLSYLYSSFLFGLYHISIFKTWFNLYLIILALAGLVLTGLILSWLDTKTESLLNSWTAHIMADSAIILIGMKMFNLI